MRRRLRRGLLSPETLPTERSIAHSADQLLRCRTATHLTHGVRPRSRVESTRLTAKDAFRNSGVNRVRR